VHLRGTSRLLSGYPFFMLLGIHVFTLEDRWMLVTADAAYYRKTYLAKSLPNL